jgi:cytochrome c-type biogenesis protein CcmH
MMFWLAAFALTLVASLVVLLPLTGKAGRDLAESEHDLNVYRDQLAEVERDRDRGALGTEEAEEARAEIARRIIRADAAGKQEPYVQNKTASRILVSVAVLLVPIISWGMYAALGSPDLPSQPLAVRLAKPPAQQSPEELVARAEKALAANPDDLRGWTALAPIYLRMDRYNDAVVAYRNVIRLAGEDADRLSGLGEAMVLAAGGAVTADAGSIFGQALAIDPTFAKARYFLALALAQDGKTTEAADAWRAIAAREPAGSAWRAASEGALAQLQGSPAAAPGPKPEQAEAVSQMSPDEQAAMIEQMVAGLDEKLRSDPNDPDGWMRLLRSYRVLGKDDAARDALKRALVALGAESEAGKRLAAFAVEQGVAQ